MRRLGLALSGGGFRAVLYHLGVVRFLRDANILSKVTHMTSVSGGSIIGAHMALNWDRYCGSEEEFEDAASELLRYVQLDVRNRIVRRFPFAALLNSGQRLLRLGSRRSLTRAGLLEKHYEKYLFGDTNLFQLPDRPRLHILSTNLSEGCLCSFHKGGLLLQRRVPGRRDRFERVEMGLATVSMAVAASSAFPGFFPPLELNGWDVGAEEGEFHRKAFTDGGVYDNLGLRMFRCIEQSWVREITPLRKDDFLELEDATSALVSAENLPEQTPLRRLREKLSKHEPQKWGPTVAVSVDGVQDALVEGLWEIIRTDELYREASFQGMELTDSGAQSLLNYVVEANRQPELNDRLWLNRQIVESALRQVIGKPCLRMSRQEFDGILVSDASGKFKVNPNSRAGGLLRTTLRATDILMDRVWQLEAEAFENSAGVLICPILDVVDRSEDRTAPHPAIQRQASRIRTDMDRFSDLEIAALVQHGYCVARKACRSQAEFLQTEIPRGAAWDPLASSTENGTERVPPVFDLNDEESASDRARELQASSQRRVWSTLFDLRDWPSYVWIPLIIAIAIYLPYQVVEVNRKSKQQAAVLAAISESSPVYKRILSLLEEGPAPPFPPCKFEEVDHIQETQMKGFEVVSDARIYDLREWSDPTQEGNATAMYTRATIRRTEKAPDNPHLSIQLVTHNEQLLIKATADRLNPVFRRMKLKDGRYQWELDLDFSHVPVGDDVELLLEGDVTDEFATLKENTGRFYFSLPLETGLSQVWVLMPEGRLYNSFEVSSFPIGEPDKAQLVVPDSKVEIPFGSIAMFRLIHPDANHRYECRWSWIDESEDSQ